MSNLHIVGGGLAGMTVAWEVTRPDGRPPFGNVHLYERSSRLGGKAGSNEVPANGGRQSAWSDHGYHLFPKWYRNVIELMGEIGVDYDDVIVDGERFSQAARLPKFRTKQRHGDARRAEIEYQSARQLFWVAITSAELVATPDEVLRELTMQDFIDRRFPMLKAKVQPVYEGLLLKALAADIEQMSALAVAKLFRRWSSPLPTLKDPSWSSLSGSLQRQFIEPFERALEASGVKIHTLTEVDGLRFDGVNVSALSFIHGESVELAAGDQVVFAVPPKQLGELLEAAPPDLGVAGPVAELARMSEQFSGIDVYFATEQLTPREHFGFQGSAITAYNITPIWKRKELVDDTAPTVVQLVMPRPGTKDADAIEATAKEELGEAFEFSDADQWVINVNADSPLSLANRGVYEAREQLERALEQSNVKVSGDFMPSSIGVPSMEGAVGNGRRVAAQLRGRNPDFVDPDVVVSKPVRVIAAAVRGVFGPIRSVWNSRTG